MLLRCWRPANDVRTGVRRVEKERVAGMIDEGVLHIGLASPSALAAASVLDGAARDVLASPFDMASAIWLKLRELWIAIPAVVGGIGGQSRAERMTAQSGSEYGGVEMELEQRALAMDDNEMFWKPIGGDPLR